MRLALTAALLLASTAAAAQTAPALSVDTLKDVTRTLSSDEFEGRAPTTAGEEKTLKYLVERFEKAGLKPGNKGSWFQDVPLVELTASNVSPLSFTGGKTPVSLDYRKDVVIATYQ
ncbi:MAG TPA: peptidase M28, partial [Sphingomonas sp.]|nr:peptidase M28 [Sphingomonas sp.]